MHSFVVVDTFSEDRNFFQRNTFFSFLLPTIFFCTFQTKTNKKCNNSFDLSFLFLDMTFFFGRSFLTILRQFTLTLNHVFTTHLSDTSVHCVLCLHSRMRTGRTIQTRQSRQTVQTPPETGISRRFGRDYAGMDQLLL